MDALALRADERRDKLRKASGRSKYPLIRRYLNGETRRSNPPSSVRQSITYGGEPITQWGCSSVGKAPALQAGGQEFESLHLHLIMSRADELDGKGRRCMFSQTPHYHPRTLKTAYRQKYPMNFIKSNNNSSQDIRG